MAVGFCVNCGEQIFEMNGTRLGHPLGNYRSLKLQMNDGTNLIVPVCIKCHDNFRVEFLDDLVAKIYKYLKEATPDNWPEEKRSAYAKKYAMKEIVNVRKQGALTKRDLKDAKVQIWN